MLAILGLALLSIIIFLGVCNSQQIVLHCTTTWRQPGLDRGFVDRLQKLATNRKQKTENKQTAVFIELLPQLKKHSFYGIFIEGLPLDMFWQLPNSKE